MSDILVIEPNDDDEYAEEAELDGVPEEEPRSRNWQMSIAAGLIVSLVLIGETVGGLIGLNNFEALELGTGSTTITNCDSALTVTPKAKTTLINGEPTFVLEYVDIAGISDECINKTFKLELYKSVGLGAGQAANIGTRVSGTPTSYVKFMLATQPSGFNGLDWKIYPTSAGLPNPLSTSGLSTCGGDNNFTDDVNFNNFDWTDPLSPGFGIVCPDDNFLVRLSGYITFPGVEDGDMHSTAFSLRSTGNAELRVGNRSVISDRGSHNASSYSGSFTHRKGTSYSFDLWYFKGVGAGELKLSWNRASDGSATGSTSVIPNSAYSFGNTVSIVIPGSEGVVNYTVEALALATNNRSVRIRLNSQIPTTDVDRFTLETSE